MYHITTQYRGSHLAQWVNACVLYWSSGLRPICNFQSSFLQRHLRKQWWQLTYNFLKQFSSYLSVLHSLPLPFFFFSLRGRDRKREVPWLIPQTLGTTRSQEKGEVKLGVRKPTQDSYMGDRNPATWAITAVYFSWSKLAAKWNQEPNPGPKMWDTGVLLIILGIGQRPGDPLFIFGNKWFI